MALCPYCKETVSLEETRKESSESNEVDREVSGLFKKEVMYSCPHCDSILGFAFFFGGLLTGRPK